MKTGKPLVLLVEDNPADVNLVEEAFAEANFDCWLYVVPDGVSAIRFIDQLDADPEHPTPDLVLLDLNLPKISGEEVLQRLRRSPRCGEIKVLIISSSDAPSDRERAMRYGASEYFRKPSGLEQFLLLGPKVQGMIAAET